MSDITSVNFKPFEEYLQELEHAQTDRQTECINTFQFGWKVLKEKKKKSKSFNTKTTSYVIKILSVL